MQTWAKRGIQTALVTGGLLMLGTGIASADEDVNPDRPASPLDGSVSIPVHMHNNAIGTPLGQVDGPSVNHEVAVSPSDLGNVPDVVSDAAGSVLGSCAPACGSAEPGGAGDAFRGNRVAGDLVIPVDAAGNAIALLGDAEVKNNVSDQSAGVNRPQVTSGHDLLAGNVVDLDYALPVQITGNAVSGLGNACAESTSTQSAAATGDIATNARGGTLSGNVLAGQWTTPVQVAGNAVSGLGTAEATSDATTEGAAGGTIRSDGNDSLGSGNAGAVPLAVPAEVTGNAVGAGAVTRARSTNEATATAGSTRTGNWNRETYVETAGDPALAAGNAVQPAAAGPVSVNCNAGAAVATADAACTSESPATAGGTTLTDGTGSVASGTIASPAVALPTQGITNAAAAAGDATATQDNTVDSSAGGENFTHGSDSVASGTVIAPTATGPADVLSNAGAGAGTAATDATNNATADAGGFTGTSGDGSLGGGSMVTAPLAVPVEGLGTVAAGAGDATSSTTEVKTSSSGGDTSTNDPGGLAAANLAQGAVSGPAQVMGNGAGVLGNTRSAVDSGSTVNAGGDNKATGTAGAVSGNIAQVAGSVPTQVFGSNATAGGVGTASTTSDTTSTAGGVAQTDGTGGLGAGNVVNAPAGSAVQAFGESAGGLGVSSAEAENATDSTAGGTTETSGAGGLGAGNVVAPQAAPLAQTFGAAASAVGGMNKASGDSDTNATSGGDIGTTGDSGTISGNLVDVPAAAAAQPHGDAVSAVGSQAHATSAGNTTGTAGGTSTTSGNGLLSGVDATVPAGVNAPVYDVPVEVLAEAMTNSTNASNLTTGETEPGVDLSSLSGSVDGLGATQMPRLPEMSGQSRADSPVPGLGQLGSLAGVFQLLGGAGGLNLPGGLPATGGLPGAGGLPLGGGLGGVTSGLPATGNLPGVGNVPDAGSLPVVGNLPGAGNLAGELPILDAADVAQGPVGGFTGGFASAPGMPRLPQVPGLPEAPRQRIAAPVTPVDGVLGQAGLRDAGQFITALTGGVPATSDLPGMAQVSSVPGVSHVPGLSGNQGVAGLSNLSADRLVQLPTVQAPVHTPALSGLDTSSVLDPGDVLESASLADTQSKLATLFGG